MRLEAWSLAHTGRRYWMEILEAEPRPPTAATSDDVCRFVAPLLARDTIAVEGEIAPGWPVRGQINGTRDFEGDLPPDCAVRDRSLREAADPFLAYDTELVLNVPSNAR